jgi:rSAM/selenodomain-associated transferase 2
MKLAIVVPTLNEAAYLPHLLESLERQTHRADEVVVSDGGSTDETVAIASAAGARLVHSERGRGVQIAAGIAATTSDVVLVLHADSRCYPRTVAAVRGHFLENPESVGGCLGHRFENGGILLRLVEWADRRRGRQGTSYGDQGQFFRRDALDRIGGFPRLPLMEDLEVARRMLTLGRPAYLDVPLISSTRGFERLGVLRTIWRNRRLRKSFLRYGSEAAEQLCLEYYGK